MIGEEKKNKIISIAIHSAVAIVLLGLLILLCFKNSAGEYFDLAIDKALSKSINGNWAKTAYHHSYRCKSQQTTVSHVAAYSEKQFPSHRQSAPPY